MQRYHLSSVTKCLYPGQTAEFLPDFIVSCGNFDAKDSKEIQRNSLRLHLTAKQEWPQKNRKALLCSIRWASNIICNLHITKSYDYYWIT